MTAMKSILKTFYPLAIGRRLFLAFLKPLCCCLLITLAPFAVRASTYPVNLQPGWTPVANHLSAGSIQSVLGAPFPQVMDMQAVFLLSPNNIWDPYYNDGSMWYDNNLNPAVYSVGNGEGAFIFNPGVTPIAATISGLPTAGIVPLNVAPGWHLRGRQDIGPGTFESIFGRSPRDYAFVHGYRFVNNVYVPFQFANSPNPANRRWSPSAPILNIGEAMVFQLGASTGPANPQYFAPNPVNFTITGVTPATSVNNTFTLSVTGTGLANGDEIKLQRMGGGPQTPWVSGTADPEGYILTATMTLNVPSKSYYRVLVRKPPGGTPQALDNAFYLNVPSSQLNIALTGPSQALPSTPSMSFYLTVSNPGGPVNNVDISTIVPGYPATVGVNIGPVTTSLGFGPAPAPQAAGVGVQTVSPFNMPANSWARYEFTVTPSPSLVTIPATTLQFVGQITAPNSQAAQSLNLVEIVSSLDPNDKTGPIGYGPQRYVTGLEPFDYRIRFENDPAATAPAKEVVVTDQLDLNRFDLATFELGTVTFGPKTVTPPSGLKNWTADVLYDVDGNPGTVVDNILVRIEAALDDDLNSPTYGKVTWKFTSRESTPPYLLIALPSVGFLPANVTSPEGEGSVAFRVSPFSNIPSGQTIENQANIVFDTNPAILTGYWTNTIDLELPLSTVSPLSATQTETSFMVYWSGEDQDSGIARYDVFVSDNGGPFTSWLSGTTNVAAQFTGQANHSYSFYSVATDVVGHIEDAPEIPDTETTVVSKCPPATIHLQRTGEKVELTWAEEGYRLQATSDFLKWEDLADMKSPASFPANTPFRFFRLICR
jgi:hypothetical protein